MLSYLRKKNNILTRLIFILVILFYHTSCSKKTNPKTIELSDNLQLIPLNNIGYIHVSYYTLKNGTKFPCNGFIYVNNKEAYIFDSPATDIATNELIEWLQNEQEISIKGVIFNHFHDDCIEGIDIFKEKNIRTIASKKTATSMIAQESLQPDQTFTNKLELTLNNKSIINTFFGEAHTSDNIVSYFPNEEVLYGGCMIKSIHAKKGNLADANTSEWSNTVTKIKKTYPNINIVIPGHGEHGKQDLLDYTINLFNTEN